MEKLIITCAPTGSLTIPTQTPYLPITPQQIADEAVRAAEVKPRALIQASASGYYDTGQERLTEGNPNGNSWQANLCHECENATAEVEALGVRRVITRTGLVLSTEGGAFPRLLLPFRLFAGGPMGSGRQWMPWIHHQDEVRAICFLIEHDETVLLIRRLVAGPEGEHAEVERPVEMERHRRRGIRAPVGDDRFDDRLQVGLADRVGLGAARRRRADGRRARS